MVYFQRWKIILISALCALAVLYALPNILPAKTVAWMHEHTPSFFPNKAVNLGLDLRGGSHLLLEVATDTVIDESMQGLVDQMRTELRGAKIGYTDLRLSNSAINFKLTDPSQNDKAKEVLRDMDRALDVTASDSSFSVRMSDARIRERKLSAMDQSVEIVRRRIDETGTREPSIQRQGENRILVQLPGVDDPQRIKDLLGQTAKLTFRFVDETANPAEAQMGRAPPGTELLPMANREGQFLVVQKRVMVSGDTLVDAQPTYDERGRPCVSFRFDSVGGRRFGEATRQNVGHLFAIVLDNKIISAPVIQTPIIGGSGQITGNFSVQEAQDLALLLRAGALPAPIKVLEERTVGPGLGADSIKAGAMASLIGLGLVVVFFVFAYGLFGIFANIALMFNIAMIFSTLSILQATLTLPGIAGIVLTIGTALDANVLIFERIREELRHGRSPISSIDAGYNHALPSIIDANVTTLIAGVILFVVGSGPVKGFAVTLIVGIVMSIFSAMMITRLIIIFWLRARKPSALPL
ncbi:MAG: protein translocase subunit SecD [Alphaproteobacteria bacterium]|nr:protein translocase subunit SecD [Alphaproteobacteria bacterium]